MTARGPSLDRSYFVPAEVVDPFQASAGIQSPAAALDEAVAAKAGELAGRPPLVTGGSMADAVAAICGVAA